MIIYATSHYLRQEVVIDAVKRKVIVLYFFSKQGCFFHFMLQLFNSFWYSQVLLPKVLEWYRKDFGEPLPQLLRYVAAYLEQERQKQLLDMANSQRLCKVEFKNYNWDFKFEYETPDMSHVTSVISGLQRIIPESISRVRQSIRLEQVTPNNNKDNKQKTDNNTTQRNNVAIVTPESSNIIRHEKFISSKTLSDGGSIPQTERVHSFHSPSPTQLTPKFRNEFKEQPPKIPDLKSVPR
jgi:hypothetical protein